MQTQIAETLLATSSGRRADEILRACVHCGFCNATCPTYLLTGDELDGPRGRIYLIKEMLEADAASGIAREHLDRCLTCRACETTCPSGVAYGELAEIGRDFVEARLPRRGFEGLLRRGLVWMLPVRGRLKFFARLGRAFRFLVPARLARAIPRIPRSPAVTPFAHARRVLLLDGCVQGAATPEVNAGLARLLDRAGVAAVRAPGERCCGALALHLGRHAESVAAMRANVDALYETAADCEAIVSSASGCGVTVKDYGRLLAEDPDYAERARWVAERTVDAAQYLATLGVPLTRTTTATRIAWHPPCTLAHGQRITGVVERLLEDAGFELVPFPDQHLCCGSAGTYSVLQPELAERLRRAKLAALASAEPELIATANVGCQLHLRDDSSVPVRHWLEIVDIGEDQ